jgi:hypothetical protein
MNSGNYSSGVSHVSAQKSAALRRASPCYEPCWAGAHHAHECLM